MLVLSPFRLSRHPRSVTSESSRWRGPSLLSTSESSRSSSTGGQAGWPSHRWSADLSRHNPRARSSRHLATTMIGTSRKGDDGGARSMWSARGSCGSLIRRLRLDGASLRHQRQNARRALGPQALGGGRIVRRFTRYGATIASTSARFSRSWTSSSAATCSTALQRASSERMSSTCVWRASTMD